MQGLSWLKIMQPPCRSSRLSCIEQRSNLKRRPETMPTSDSTTDKKTNDYKQTDAGNAELFAKLYGAKFRFDHRSGRWYVWASHFWREDVGRVEVSKHAKLLARK